MRIISGSAKGRRLFSPVKNKRSNTIRPTSDRAREAIFNIIGLHSLNESFVLDLFAGTGALGLEALSRGASAAVFVDNYQQSLKLINKNIKICNFPQSSLVIKKDISKGLSFLKDRFYDKTIQQHNFQGKFDLIFLDPPYEKQQTGFLLEEIQNNQLIHSNSLVIFEDRVNAKLPDKIDKLILFDHRKYGDTGFWLYENAPHTYPEVAITEK